MTERWQEEIFAEKRLLDVYVQARAVASTRFNFWLSVSVFGLLAVYGFVSFWSHWSLFPRESIRELLLTIGQMGFALSTSILGFLITGFAIFSSIIKLNVFIVLAKLPHQKSGISRLKFVFFNFLFIFIHYVSLLVFCFMVSVFSVDDGPFSGLNAIAYAATGEYFYLVGFLMTSIALAWVIFCLLLLKSFIWNLYQSILLAIAAEAAMPPE